MINNLVYPAPDEQLNIVFKKGTAYVRSEDILEGGKVKPYVLHNIDYYRFTDNKLIIQFKAFHTLEEDGEVTQHTGVFNLANITRVYTSKVA